MMEYRINNEESASIAVVQAVSEYRNKSYDQLTPLYDYVDPDALDRLVKSFDEDAYIEFEFDDIPVAVGSDRVCLAYDETSID